MAVIVLHVGLPKTGSTSIQRWMAANFVRVRQQGFTLVVAPGIESGEIEFVPYDGETPVNSGRIVSHAIGRPEDAQARIADAFVEALAAAADRYEGIVVSSEAFVSLFGSSPALAALQRLSTRHEVRVAFYARPQHSILEALWRETGYRSGKTPSAFLEERAVWLHYAATRRRVWAEAPGLGFEPTPFRRDLLRSGEVVADFADRFLGVEAGPSEWANPGLPLEVINLLRVAPKDMFWGEELRGRRLNRIKAFLADNPLPEDERIALSRRVLQKYAHERFAAENAELGWEDFVPPPEDADELPGIEALDKLWTPQASVAERALLFRVLDAAV